MHINQINIRFCNQKIPWVIILKIISLKTYETLSVWNKISMNLIPYVWHLNLSKRSGYITRLTLKLIVLWPTENAQVRIRFIRFIKTPQTYRNIPRGRKSVVQASWPSLSHCRIIEHDKQLQIDNKTSY